MVHDAVLRSSKSVCANAMTTCERSSEEDIMPSYLFQIVLRHLHCNSNYHAKRITLVEMYELDRSCDTVLVTAAVGEHVGRWS